MRYNGTMTNLIWADVYNAAGNRLGAGPLTNIYSANVSRMLDGAGTFSLTTSASDKDALDLMTNERRLHIWTERGGVPRLFAQGIIRNRDIAHGGGGLALSVSGIGIMDELKRRNTLIARSYTNQTLQQVADDLISLVPGWTVNVSSAIASSRVDLRLDGVSVLKGFQKLFERYGYHIRLNATTPKQLDVSLFGDDSGYRAHFLETMYIEAQLNPDILVVENISENLDSESVFNRLYVIGAGEGSAALTLDNSTRTTPYTIGQVANNDGTASYYVEDAASVASYGRIEKFVVFKEINTLSNSTADLEAASNALYDAAVAHLVRHKDPYEAYRLSLRNLDRSLQVGDMMHMDYIAAVDTDDGEVKYLELRGDYWIMESSESVSQSGMSAQVTVTNIDRHPDTVAARVMDAIEAVQARDLKPSTSSNIRTYVYTRQINANNAAHVPLEFTAATRTLQRVRMNIVTRPLRTHVVATAANEAVSSGASGDHRHLVFRDLGSSSNTISIARSIQYASDLIGTIRGAVLGFGAFNAGDMYTSGASGNHTHQIPAHSHPITYGIFEDVATPRNIRVKINGIDRTLLLFEQSTLDAMDSGRIDATGDSGEFSNLLYQVTGGLRQRHDIEISCASGQGEVEVQIEVFEITQTVALPLDTTNIILTLPTDIPATPTPLTVTAGDSTAVIASGSVVIADTYEYRWRIRNSGNAWTVSDRVTAPTVNATGLTNGSEYEFQAAARNENGLSAWSASVYATPMAAAAAPPTPTGYTATAANARFTWECDFVADANAYIVRWREDGTTDTYSTQVFTTNSGTVTGLDNGKTYETAVAARNAIGDSAYTSPAVNVSPVLTEPPGKVFDMTFTTISVGGNMSWRFNVPGDQNRGTLDAGSQDFTSLLTGNDARVNQWQWNPTHADPRCPWLRSTDNNGWSGRASTALASKSLYLYNITRGLITELTVATQLQPAGEDAMGWAHDNPPMDWESGDQLRMIFADSGELSAVLDYVS